MTQILAAARCGVLALACLTLASCSGSGSSASTSPVDTLTLSLAQNSLAIFPDGSLSTVAATIARSAGSQTAITLAVSGAPAGVTVALVQPALGNYGSVTLSSSAAATAGSYPISIAASDGTASSSATLSLTLFPADSLSLSAAAPSLLALQDGTAASTAVSVVRATGYSKSVTLSATGLPTGLTAAYTQPGTTSAGTVTFTTSATPAAAGTYAVTLTASDGTASTTTGLSITVGIVATVANAVDTTLGTSGTFLQAMSTNFQPSTYDDPFLTTFPSTANLTALNLTHIRIQPGQTDVPWLANSATPAATDWNFVPVDKTVQPLLATGDQSPIFQIATAPFFLNDANGHFLYSSANLQLLAAYAQNLVRYYNAGGFTWGGKHFQSASSQHITWWAIFNEPNLNNVTAAQYVQIYNTLVSAMQSIDPTLKFTALELSDYAGQPAVYMPQLVLPVASGGLSAQVNALATHFYGSCAQTTTDTALFAKVPQFASDVSYIRSELKTRTDLAAVPVWVTENNVNSDYNLPNGYSNCTPTQLFVNDPRGTSAFFTSWRPYVFSQLGKAGNQALYHFLYEGSSQYGEVNNTTAVTTLAYWTDYWLERTFPALTGATVLKTSTTEPTPSIEVLAVRNADNSVSLLVANLAVASATDDNGAGARRTVNLNLSALGTFSSGTQVSLNAATSATSGPATTAIQPSGVLPVTFSGYGSAFFVLKP